VLCGTLESIPFVGGNTIETSDRVRGVLPGLAAHLPVAAVFGTCWALGWTAISVIVIRHSLMHPGSNALAHLEQLLPWIAISLVAFQGNYHQSRLARLPTAPTPENPGPDKQVRIPAASGPKISRPDGRVRLAMDIDQLRSVARASSATKDLVTSGEVSVRRSRKSAPADADETPPASPIEPPQPEPEIDPGTRQEHALEIRRFRHKQLHDALDEERWVTARTIALPLAEEGDAEAQYHLGGLNVTGKGGSVDLREAGRWLRRAAAHGHPAAERLLDFVGSAREYRIGHRYLRGSDQRAPDWRRAVKWLRRAAERRHLPAIDLLSLIARRGKRPPTDSRDALARLETNAREGSLRTQLLLADMYLQGRGVQKNHWKAAAWAREAAKRGDARGQHLLALLYIFGDPEQQDLDKAFVWCQKAARQGEPASQGMLGDCYFWAMGTDKDPVEAVRWWRLAAAGQSAVAQYRLGCFYYFPPDENSDPREEPQDIEQGIDWLRRAAEQGHAAAQALLGQAHLFGVAAESDFGEGLLWTRRGAQGGASLAQFRLGDLYQSGRGVPRDDREAARWFHLAAAQGDPIAQTRLGNQYRLGKGVERNESEAAYWFHVAAMQGQPEAQYRLACLYEKGWGVPRDERKAFEWFLAAARQDVPSAQLQAGLMYFSGRGVEMNLEEAVGWLEMAAGWGLPLAQHHLGACFAAGHGVAQNSKKAFFWHTLAAAGAAPGSPDARAKLSGLLTSVQRRDVLDAAERWISAFSEWKGGRRPAPPDVEEWL
jgi:TPR repeat protein